MSAQTIVGGSTTGGRADSADAAASPDAELAAARRRQRGLVVAGIGAVMMLAVGWLVFGRDDGAADLEAVTEDSIPAQTDVEDSLPTELEPDDTEPDPDEPDPDDSGPEADSTSTGTGTGTGDGDPGEWSEGAVDLPQELLDATVAFELVALTNTGDVVQVSVPSGDMDSVSIGRGVDGRVIAGETATLYLSYRSSGEGKLLRVGQPPLELTLPSNVDVRQVGVTSDEFAGVSYGNGEERLVRIQADGGVVTTDTDDAGPGVWQRNFTADGSAVVGEAGGVYVGGDDGFERISTGSLISVSTNHLLVRECDETMVCGYATIAFDTGERVTAVIEDDSLGRFGFNSAKVSPDGRWVRYLSFGDNSPREVVIDLVTGERTELDFADTNFGQESKVWAADSSGFFRISREAGLEFYVLATEETISFGEELGRVQSFDIRPAPGNAAAIPAPLQTTTEISLLALTTSGDVAQIDVDSAAVITTDGPGVDSSAPVTIFPDSAGATITSYDNVPSLRFRATDGTVVEIDETGPGGPLWPGPFPGTVWQTGASGAAADLALELVDAQGNDRDARLEFGDAGFNDIVGSDGRFGIVVETELGGVFALDASNPPERITSGELLAINATVAFVRECDDTFQCGVFAVDRESSERTLVDNNGFARAGGIGSRAVPSGQNVSPDGMIAFVRNADDPTNCLMIDTSAIPEAWTAVPCVDAFGPVIWTADSNYAVWLADGRVTVYERATTSVRVVNTPELTAIAAVDSEQ